MPTTTTLTVTELELRVIRLAIRNWDGWDDAARTTISGELDETHTTLRNRIMDAGEL